MHMQKGKRGAVRSAVGHVDTHGGKMRGSTRRTRHRTKRK